MGTEIVVISKDELLEAIDTAVSNAVERVTKLYNTEKEEDKLMTLEQLQNYLPEHPAKQTVYGWTNNRKIPYEKHGSTLYFRKSEIDNWLESGRVMNRLKTD